MASSKAKPFRSQSLDNLAESMHAVGVLKNDELRRYYELPFLQANSLAFIDKVFFDSKYLETLSPDELLAVGAHEFHHIIKRHGRERVIQVIVPSILAALTVGVLVFLTQTDLFTLFLAPPLSFVSALIAFFYINASWFRRQETECDLNAVEVGKGEAMISALEKANKQHPVNRRKLTYQLMPKTYPSLEQRITDIQDAMRKQPNLKPKTH